MLGNCTGNGTKVSGVTSPDVITSLTNGTTYYYMMTCVNAAGESACSSEVSGTPNVTVTVPGAPTSVAATAGNTQNTITWSAPSSGGTVTSYNLYWKSGSSMSGNCTGNGTKVSGVTSPDVITSLTNGTTYYYMLTAVNATGEGTCSSEVTATPVAIPVQQGGYSGTLTASSVGQTGPSGGIDVIMQNYPLTASTITEAKIENYYAQGGGGHPTTAWIRFKVWRLSSGTYTLIGTTPEISMQTTIGLQTYTFTGITCQTGDLLGFSTNAAGTGSPYGSVDALNSGSGTWYSENGDITSGTLTQSGMTSHTTYQNMQIQFWGN